MRYRQEEQQQENVELHMRYRLEIQQKGRIESSHALPARNTTTREREAFTCVTGKKRNNKKV